MRRKMRKLGCLLFILVTFALCSTISYGETRIVASGELLGGGSWAYTSDYELYLYSEGTRSLDVLRDEIPYDYEHGYTLIVSGGFDEISLHGDFEFDRIIVEEGVYTINTMAANASEIQLPTSVKEIKSYAFAENNDFNSIKIPGKGVTIGERAFWDCNNLFSVELGKNVYISEEAFAECGFDRVNIPDGAYVECRAFRDTPLKEVYIYSSDVTLENYAFGDNENLKIVCDADSRACEVAVENGYKIECLSCKTVIIPAVDATCREPGLSEGEKCYACGMVAVEQEEVPPKGHTYGNDYICDACGYENESLKPAPKPAVDLSSGIVSENLILTEDVTIKGDLTIEKNCTLTVHSNVIVEGNVYVYGELVVYGSMTIDKTLYALNYNAALSDDSYNEGAVSNYGGLNVGSMDITGSFMNKDETNSGDGCISSMGHFPWGEATCTSAQICVICDKELIPAKGHTPGTAATCTAAQKCTTCQANLAPAKGHTPGVAATCTAPQKCTTCQADLAPASGHVTGSEKVTKATAVKAGQKVTACATCGKVLKTVTIKPAKVTLSKTGVNYTGKKVMAPVVRVKTAAGKVIPVKYYTVTKPKNVTKMKDIGRYAYTIKFKENCPEYKGTVKLYFEIKPAKTTIKAPAAAKKAVTVKWAKGKKDQVTGYEVLAATNNTFTKGKKTVTVKGYTKTSGKVTKLKAKTKYFVKVRSYKTVKGVKIYSDWSKVKTIKTK